MRRRAALPALALLAPSCKTRSVSEAKSAKAPAAPVRSFACESGSSTPVKAGKTVKAPGPTVAYHWADEEEVLTPQGLATWMERKFEAARTTPFEASGNAFGEGLYLASNPLSTAGSGRILVVVPLKGGCDYALAETTDWESSKATRDALESALAGVVYAFDADERAVLVRDTSAVSQAEAFAINTRAHEGEPLESVPPRAFPGGGWKDALRYYGASYSFLAHTAVKDTASGAPLLAGGGLTDTGFAVALHAELSSGGTAREKALDDMLARAPTLVDFPTCARKEERFPWRGSKYRQCVSALFESVAVQVAPELATSMESPMSVEEAHAVFTALGYAALLPPVTEAQAPFFKGFFGNWKKAKDKAPAAEALVRASLRFGKDATGRRIEDWF